LILNNIYENYLFLLKNGILPVVVYMETEEVGNKFFQSKEFEKFDILTRISDYKNRLRKMFDLKELNITSIDSLTIGLRIMFKDSYKGTIRYFGKLMNDKSNNDWVGIEWDIEGVGKNDGIAFGKRYFQTKKNTATFVKLEDFNEKLDLTFDDKSESNEFYPDKEDPYVKTSYLNGFFLISENKILREYRFEKKQEMFNISSFVTSNSIMIFRNNEFLKDQIDLFSKKTKNQVSFSREIVSIKESISLRNLKNQNLREIDMMIQKLKESDLYKQNNVQVIKDTLNLLNNYKIRVNEKRNLNDIEKLKADFVKINNLIDELVTTDIHEVDERITYTDLSLSDKSVNENNRLNIKIDYDIITKRMKLKIMKYLPIPKEAFNYKTNEEISLHQITENSNILLIFLTSMHLVSTKTILNEIVVLYSNFIKLNIIPIIVHMESQENIINYFSSNEILKKYELITRIEDKSGELRKIFKVSSSKNEETFNKLYRESKNIKKENIDHKGLSSFFYIEDDVIINEFRSNNLNDIPNLLKLTIDQNKLTTSNSMRRSRRGSIIMQNKVDYVTKNRKRSPSLINSVIKRHSIPKKKKIDFKNVKVPLEHIVESSELAEFFKLHLTKEYSVENILFIEQVMNFKRVEEDEMSIKIAKEIFDEFLVPDCVNEVKYKLKID
jgi:hypothetical protein